MVKYFLIQQQICWQFSVRITGEYHKIYYPLNIELENEGGGGGGSSFENHCFKPNHLVLKNIFLYQWSLKIFASNI